MTWFPDNGHLPENHGGNDLLKLKIINECILSLNLDNGITKFLGFINMELAITLKDG